MRVVIDTNVWVSALLNPEGHPARLLTAFRQQRFITVVSQPLMSELAEVLQRPHLDLIAQLRANNINIVSVQQFLNILDQRGEP